MDAECEFASLMAGPDEGIDLARAALNIARDAYPDLDPTHHLADLDRLAGDVLAGAGAGPSVEALLASLDHQLFTVAGFAGNAGDYYDPRNSYLNQVMERRQGIPITLCLLYMEVARRAGIDLEPVGFPSHFLLALDRGGDRVFIDPFHAGRRLDRDDLEVQLRALVGAGQARALYARAVAAVSRREVVTRILRNLKMIHARSGDWARALPVSNRLVFLEATPGSERRDRGRIHEHLQAWRAAKADYEAWLAGEPDDADAASVMQRVEALRARVSRLN